MPATADDTGMAGRDEPWSGGAGQGAARNLLFGLRLALAGGRGSRVRTALTTAGVTLGVVLLLFASSAPHMVSAHDARTTARAPSNAGSHPRLYLLPLMFTAPGGTVNGYAVERAGSRAAPLPPGVRHLPAPGQMVVSPALKALLDSPAGTDARRQLDGARIIGTIAETGLAGPGELYVYLGARGLATSADGQGVSGFGQPGSIPARGPVVTLLVIIMVIVLLLPVGFFVATASRFGGEERHRRLAALRLVGADRASTARIAAGESLLGSLIGVLLGLVIFYAALKTLIPHVQIAGLSVFSSDVQPSPVLLLLTVVLVPVAAVVFSLAAMRRVSVEPLGVTRRGSEPRRRLWWRLAIPALGLLLLVPLIGSERRIEGTSGTVELAAGVIFVLVGVCALLPWLVEAVVLRAGPGPVPWLLAVRRLRADHGTAGRVVGAIGLAVAGAIALQTVFAGIEATHGRVTPAVARSPSGSLASTQVIQVNGAFATRTDRVNAITKRLAAIPGVVEADVISTVAGQSAHPATVASCQTIERLPGYPACAEGSIFVTGRPEARRIRIGERWYRIPAGIHVRHVNQNVVGQNGNQMGLTGFVGINPPLLTPRAADQLGVGPSIIDAVVYQRPDTASVQQQVQNVVVGFTQLATVETIALDNGLPHAVKRLNNALTAGAVAVLIVIGFSLLVAVVEQLRERRRVLAALSAFGTRTSTLAWSVLWQTGLLLIAGLVLAVAIGIALGAVLMRILGETVAIDLGSIGQLVGAGALVVIAVTVLTLPILWTSTRPETLRAE